MFVSVFWQKNNNPSVTIESYFGVTKFCHNKGLELIIIDYNWF